MNDKLVLRLHDLADQLDRRLSDPSHMGVHNAYGDVGREVTDPPHVAMTPDAVAAAEKAGWYMSEQAIIARLDANKVKQIALLDGTILTRSPYRLFVNPYGPTGLTGPGVLGVFQTPVGPSPENRAVDSIPYFVGDDDRLYFFGITRQASDGSKPAFNGGFNEGGAFKTVVKEFIEESVSSSALALIQSVTDAAYPLMRQEVEGQKLLEAWKNAKTQIVDRGEDQILLERYGVHAHLDKGEVVYKWLIKNRPEFVAEVTDLFQRDKLEVYRGPVKSDPRNTDTRWIATQVFASHVPKNELTELLARHHLSLQGGSDAASTNIHSFDAKFVLNAYASHGPILMHAFAEILKHNQNLPASVYKQAQELIDDISKYLAKEPKPELPIIRKTIANPALLT